MALTCVLDSSAVLALLQDEPGGDVVAPLIATAAVSAVNVAEIVAKLSDKGVPAEIAQAILDQAGIACLAFDRTQAHAVGRLRPVTRQRELSLGDNACLALALTLGVPAWTADRDWATLKLDVEVNLIR